jgi:hypothetical protein
MIETEITISINRKSDIDLIKQKIINSKIRFPIYILEYENSHQLNFTSDYEEWELDSAILGCFPEYEFTSDLERGRKEIRLQITRYQSEFSTDGWGRPIENPINETKYLIKKSINKPEKFNPKIKVLFNEYEQHYYINIVNGIAKNSGEKGFLLLNEFKTENNDDETGILKDRLYKTPLEAFHSGYYKIQELVNQDFKKYIENKKKGLREQQKVPRKIIRDFINSCNKSENEGIFKNLDVSIIFEERINWQTKLRIEGIEELEEYIKSQKQDLCARNFKIRSSWEFNMPSVTIGVKYFPVSTNSEKETGNILQYRRIRFVFKNDKIVSITEEK